MLDQLSIQNKALLPSPQTTDMLAAAMAAIAVSGFAGSLDQPLLGSTRHNHSQRNRSASK